MADLVGDLRRRLKALPGVVEGESMFGHVTAYWVNGKEVAHFETDTIVEIRLTKAEIGPRRGDLKADSRVTLRPSGADWLTVRFRSPEDLDIVVDLVTVAEKAHRPPAGAAAKAPPTGSELERRRRFH
jgi:hypothetical protein